jgi:hypothetical protein
MHAGSALRAPKQPTQQILLARLPGKPLVVTDPIPHLQPGRLVNKWHPPAERMSEHIVAAVREPSNVDR